MNRPQPTLLNSPLDPANPQALPHSEATYRIMIEGMNLGFCVVELIDDQDHKAVDYRFVEVNAVFERQTGFTGAQGQRARQLAPNVPQAWIDTLDAVARTGQPLRTEAFFDDPARWYAISLSRPGQDVARRVAAVFDDITATKQAQAERQQSEDRAQFLLELSDAMRALTDPVSMQLTATRLALAYFKADRAYYCEVAGGQVSVRQHAARPDLPPIPATYSLDQFPSMKAMLLQGQPVAVADAVSSKLLDPIMKDLCSRLCIGAYLQVPLLAKGELVAKFCITQEQPRDWTPMDIQLASETAQRTWDVAQRARTEAALGQSEAKYRNLFESIDEGFCQIQLLFDAYGQPIDWLYLDANPTFERQVGVHPIGQTVSQIVGSVEAFWFDFYHQVVRSGQPARTENYVAALDRWYTIYASPVGESTDQLTVVFDDCSARKQLEATLRVADRRKDEYLAMLAHELRNPLATLRNGLQILSLDEDHDAPTRATLAMMNRQTDHLVGMVDDLLDVSRISQGKIVLKTKRLDLVELVSQTVEAQRPLLAQRGHRLAVNLPTSPVYLEGDETRLGQVVTNLLTNAARYTPAGGQVWLSLSQPADLLTSPKVMLQVRDTGIGLAAEHLSAIFDLFVQVDNSPARSQGGLGLGLTLVRRLVELHGGEVGASSAGPGKGSTFTVHLPVLAAEPTQRSTPAQASAGSQAKTCILVIDDNADAALTMGMLLKLKGYEAHTRTSGQAGMAAAEQLKPAIILLDLGMPELDGFETCRLLRQQVWGQTVRVIALSGYGSEEDQRRTREAGFDGHLIKPIDWTAFTNLLTDG